jgi:hypothetical protein
MIYRNTPAVVFLHRQLNKSFPFILEN